MPEKILRAVANPAALFWAPQMPAMINFGLHALLIVYGWALFKMSPLMFIATTIVCHIAIASQGVREPHLSTIIQAWAVTLKTTKNLIKSKRKTYVP